MFNFRKLFSPSGHKKYEGIVADINGREESLRALSDNEIRAHSEDLKKRAREEGADIASLMPEAFALVREAARRTLQQRHFDVQLMGGAALFEGKIAEMGTGEGKTLAATSPVYAHALSGKGVHVITVNDYLAQRDAVWMGQVYAFLGLSTACIVHDHAYVYDASWVGHEDEPQEAAIEAVELDKERDQTGSYKVQKEFLRPVSRAEAYKADIVYGTNHEFGFDYLRDNLAYSSASQVQRGHYYAVIDEVDSILIDEARTPLIISAPDTEAAGYYRLFASLVSQLVPEEDYEVNEKDRYVSITESGIGKIEKALQIDNLYDPQHVRLAHYLEESLKARALFIRDRHYISRNGEIIIVDEFTGRLMHGRRYSGGLHQAIEAKEGVAVQQESKTFAQITIQNYFRLYEKIGGMTGTAETSAEEFEKVYGLEVVQIPTNKPRIRTDMPDLIYKTKQAKYEAIVKRAQECVKRGQPLLIGTTSIDENELLSARLSDAGITHEVLNAKNHEREGEIIAQAGKPGRVTLATNMAGRGVDIILGGNPSDPIEASRVREAGGLFVLGTQRNDARRIDNQLRGRAGRQGDPGTTQFFLSLEDDMLRIFGGDRIKSLMGSLNMPDDMPLESGIVVRVLNEAQKKVEGLNFDARKHLLEYDDVLNRQRKAVYRRRQNIMERVEKGETEEALAEMVRNFLSRMAGAYDIHEITDEQKAEIQNRLRESNLILPDASLSEEDFEAMFGGEIPAPIRERIAQSAPLPETGMRLLASLDIYWTNHLENLEALLEAVRMRAYGQKDPLVEYKRESYDMFKNLLSNAEDWVVANAFTQLSAKAVKSMEAVAPSGPQASSDEHHVGRNDPCWCGSGKKYKKCHGA
jgi:preprotein translocase subunit SecA